MSANGLLGYWGICEVARLALLASILLGAHSCNLCVQDLFLVYRLLPLSTTVHLFFSDASEEQD